MNERIMVLAGRLKDISSELADILDDEWTGRTWELAVALFDIALEIETEASAGGGG